MERRSRANQVIALQRMGAAYDRSLAAQPARMLPAVAIIAAALGVLPVFILTAVAFRGTTFAELYGWLGTAPRTVFADP